jgi:hypothetical protein
VHDVVVDDIDINDADVAGRRRRIGWLELQLSSRQRWWQAGGGKLGVAATSTSKERATQSVIKRGGDAGREVAIQQPAGAREMVSQRERRRCNNQPARERCSARREMVARQEREGVVRQGVARAA